MKRFWMVGLLWLIMMPVQAAMDLPLATDLQALGKQAEAKQIPIAILFTAEGLKSREKLLDEALIPELRSGELDGKVLFVEIQANTDRVVKDFYGEPTPSRAFRQLYNLYSLPVVVFVNGEGDVLTEPLMSGAYDYYGFYLKQKIEAASQALKAQ